MTMVGVVCGSLQADSQPGSFGLAEGRRPLGAVPFSLHELGSVAVALSYDDSTINIVVIIIIIVIIKYVTFRIAKRKILKDA